MGHSRQKIAEDLKDLQNERELLCMKMLEIARQNKSKDPFDIPNEPFKPDVAVDDMILAITKLMNRIKDELIYSTSLYVCNVTNLF